MDLVGLQLTWTSNQRELKFGAGSDTGQYNLSSIGSLLDAPDMLEMIFGSFRVVCWLK